LPKICVKRRANARTSLKKLFIFEKMSQKAVTFRGFSQKCSQKWKCLNDVHEISSKYTKYREISDVRKIEEGIFFSLTPTIPLQTEIAR
jgi:hypothetical protein